MSHQIPEEEILSEDLDQELGKVGRGNTAGLAHMNTVQRNNYAVNNGGRTVESAGADSDENHATVIVHGDTAKILN